MKHLPTILCLAALATTTSALAQGSGGDPTYNAVQSKRGQPSKNPYGLSIVDKVQTRESDEGSRQFAETALPSLEGFISVNLSERQAFGGTLNYQIDPARLTLATDHEVRTYMITEGAGYHNMLGFNVDSEGIDPETSRLIFPDASVPSSYFQGKKNPKRTKNFPLLPGDFVDLGTFSAGQTLDFFLIADDKNRGYPVYDASVKTNPDGINHMVAFSYAVEDSPYLVLGFEDLFNGGDRDFNDIVFAIDIGTENVNALVAAPEPGTFAALGASGLVYYLRRRRQAVPA